MNNNQPSAKCGTHGGFSKGDRTAWFKGGRHKCVQPPHAPPGKAWRIVLLGPPGLGKASHAELLCENLGTCHLCTGEVFRAAMDSRSESLSPALHNAIESMQHGDVVPDETVLNMVGERLHCLSCSGGFVLNGFPRTVTQAKALDQVLENNNLKLTAVINYAPPVEQIISHFTGRRTCTGCGEEYHFTTRPPKNAGHCDHCGGTLSQRDEDQPEAVTRRLKTYHHSANPLVEFYREHGLLLNVHADFSTEAVNELLRMATRNSG